MEDFTKVLELAREVWHYLKDKPVQKISFAIFTISLIVSLSVPFLSSILGGMYELIRAITALTALISVACIFSNFFVNWLFSLMERRKAEKEARAREIEEEREHQEREAALEREREEEELKKAVKLRELGDRAKTVLKESVKFSVYRHNFSQ